MLDELWQPLLLFARLYVDALVGPVIDFLKSTPPAGMPVPAPWTGGPVSFPPPD